MKDHNSPHLQTDLFDQQIAAEFYEDRYNHGYMDEWPIFKKQRIFELLRSLNLPAEGRALDLGCGNGVFTNVIKQALPKWQVFGAEISSTAVAQAQSRYPDCQFLVATDAQLSTLKFDFVFTHHVLEHVYNVREFLSEAILKLQPSAHMLHICPCGNEGSLEDQFSRMVKNGIDANRENRRFFEEPGHLRRLTTTDVTNILEDFGFRLRQDWYANHYWETIHWFTEWQRAEVLKLTDAEQAIDPAAAESLKKWRRNLLALTLLRLPLKTREVINQKVAKNFRDQIKLFGALGLAPVAKIADRWITKKGMAEWEALKGDKRGGEMYLYFTRAAH